LWGYAKGIPTGKPRRLGFPNYPELPARMRRSGGKHGAIHINTHHLTIRLLAETGLLNVYEYSPKPNVGNHVA